MCTAVRGGECACLCLFGKCESCGVLITLNWQRSIWKTNILVKNQALFCCQRITTYNHSILARALELEEMAVIRKAKPLILQTGKLSSEIAWRVVKSLGSAMGQILLKFPVHNLPSGLESTWHFWALVASSKKMGTIIELWGLNGIINMKCSVPYLT